MLFVPAAQRAFHKTRKHQPNEPQNLSTQTIPPGDLGKKKKKPNKLIKQISGTKKKNTMLFNALAIQSPAGEDVVYDSTNQVFHCGGQTIVVTHSVSCR